MKIDNSMKGVSGVRTRETRGGKSKPKEASKPGNLSADSVELTQTSAKLSALAESLAQVETIETSKVETVRQAIAEGRFQVDEQAVADAMVDGAMDQLRHQGKQ